MCDFNVVCSNQNLDIFWKFQVESGFKLKTDEEPKIGLTEEECARACAQSKRCSCDSYSYNAEKAPSSLAKGYPLDIDTKIDIENIDSIDTVNMLFSLTIKLHLQWYDKVLMFSNLIPESNNFIPHHKRDLIWYPTRDIVHENAIIGETKYNYDNYDMTVYASNPEKSDVRNPIEKVCIFYDLALVLFLAALSK